MRHLLILLLFIFFIGCQGGDKHYENYNITGPEKVETGANVSISVKGDNSGSGSYRTDKRDTRNINITNPPNNGGNE